MFENFEEKKKIKPSRVESQASRDATAVFQYRRVSQSCTHTAVLAESFS